MIGIAITTKNRPDAFNECIEHHIKFKPIDSIIIVVDDGSDPDYANDCSWFRFDKSVGISKAKNKCLEILYNLGCETFFLFDDDTYPISEQWEVPYIESGLHHLCYTFLPLSGRRGKIKTHCLGNGCALFFTKHCIDAVGGFDTNFRNKMEHVELSRRINNAGLTPAKFCDVFGSEKLIYCKDSDHSIERSFTPEEMDANIWHGYKHFNDTRNSKAFIPFR